MTVDLKKRRATNRCLSLAAAALLAVGLAPSLAQADDWQAKIDEASNTLSEELIQGLFPEASTSSIETTALLIQLKSAGLGLSTEAVAFKRLDKDGDGLLKGNEVPESMSQSAGSAGVNLDDFTKFTQEQIANEGRGRGRGRRGSNPSADIEFAGSLDQNRDGKVMQEEVRAAVMAALVESFEGKKSLDIDGDGKISKREYAISMPKKFGDVDEFGLDGHARGHFQREDFDDDGVLSIDEVSSPIVDRLAQRVRTMQLAVRIAVADADKNQSITADEFAAKFDGDQVMSKEAWSTLNGGGETVDVFAIYSVLSALDRESTNALQAQLK